MRVLLYKMYLLGTHKTSVEELKEDLQDFVSVEALLEDWLDFVSAEALPEELLKDFLSAEAMVEVKALVKEASLVTLLVLAF